MKYDIAVVIGRFQPYHNSHHKLVKYALSLGQTVLILLGSAKKASDTENPFTPEMREAMIRACFDVEDNKRLKFVPVRDYPYNLNTWISEVQNIVRNEQEEYIVLPEEKDSNHKIELGKVKVAIVGHFKDETSFYLDLFPQWTREDFYDDSKEAKKLNATDIRAMYLTTPRDVEKSPEWIYMVPEPVRDFLVEFAQTEQYKWLAEEYVFNEQYKKDATFVGLSFKPTFVTTDAVVTCKGHVLVVRRKRNPGKGLIALPGGFLAEGLTLEDNAIKELRQETRIHIPFVLLKSMIKDSHVFDAVKRSKRGRTITHAYYIPITTKVEDGLPLVRGGDDADKAFWLPLAALGENEDKFFEDHIHIIRHFTGVA